MVRLLAGHAYLPACQAAGERERARARERERERERESVCVRERVRERETGRRLVGAREQVDTTNKPRGHRRYSPLLLFIVLQPLTK